MAMTLMEAAKRYSSDLKRSAVIELFPSTSPLLNAMSFMDIPGNSYSYNVEAALPGIGFRAVNAGYSESTGIINPETERLRIAGGDLDVDKFIVDTVGGDVRSQEEAMKAKALALTLSDRIINGNSVANPDEFDGLRARIVGSQLFPANLTAPSANSALSLEALDAAIDEVDGANAILCSRALRRKLVKAARANLGGDISVDEPNMFGWRVQRYNGLPLIDVDVNAVGQRIIDANEAGPAGGTTNTSLYVCSFGEGKIMGLQNGTMRVEDLGELESKPVFRTRVEWYVSMAVLHPRAAARVWGITGADVTA